MMLLFRFVVIFAFAMVAAGIGLAQSPEELSPPAAPEQRLTLAWGERHIPLELWAPPYYFRADITLTVEEIWSLFQEPIRFFQNGRPYHMPGLQVKAIISKGSQVFNLYDTTGVFGAYAPPPPSGFDGWYFPDSAHQATSSQKAYFLEGTSQVDLINKFRMGDRIIFTTPPGKAAGIVLTGINIRAHNPWAEFKTRYYIPPFEFSEPDPSSWQVVEVPHRSQGLLRFDPLDESNQRVRKSYEGNPRFTLVPIAGFRSGSRHVSGEDYVVPIAEVERVDTLLTRPMLDPFLHPDVVIDFRDGWVLKWGNLEATTTIPFAKNEAFREATRQPLMLRRGLKPLPVLQCRVTIAPPQGPVIQFIMEGQNPDSWVAWMDHFHQDLSLYFEDILFQDTDGQVKRLGIPFALNVFGPR